MVELTLREEAEILLKKLGDFHQLLEKAAMYFHPDKSIRDHTYRSLRLLNPLDMVTGRLEGIRDGRLQGQPDILEMLYNASVVLPDSQHVPLRETFAQLSKEFSASPVAAAQPALTRDEISNIVTEAVRAALGPVRRPADFGSTSRLPATPTARG